MPEVFLPVKKNRFFTGKETLYFLPVFLTGKKHFSVCNINFLGEYNFGENSPPPRKMSGINNGNRKHCFLIMFETATV